MEELQDCKITFPLFADVDGSVSRVYGLVRPGTVGNAAKSVINAGLTVIIDLDKRIRFISQSPATTGRNFYEILRGELCESRNHKIRTVYLFGY